MIKNIVFDMGRVLIRFDQGYFVDRLGYSGGEKQLLLENVFYRPEWEAMDRGDLTETEALPLMQRHLPASLHEAARRLVMEWDRPILEVPGTYRLVEEFKQRGYGIYLLSNASRRQHEYWDRVPCSRFFDGTLISADVRLVKPDPAIFRKLFETFGLKPEECFFIDDHGPNVETARAVGMQAAVFRNDTEEIRSAVLRCAGAEAAERG